MPLVTSRRAVLGGLVLLPQLLVPLNVFGSTTDPLTGFTHSVASGDPQDDSVVLWTRYVPTDWLEVELGYEVAEDESFARIVVRGLATVSPDNDWCAHACPNGLRPGRWYWYRFTGQRKEISPVGRTRTLPQGRTDRVRIGVFSCANATSGWFTAYAHAAARDDLDLLIHTGDYIYESATDRSDAVAAITAARGVQPAGEAIALADYRLRYAGYRRDPGLVELHRQFPMITIWDDHETANNAWAGGAKNHDEGEGEWAVRAAAGIRAWREWLPMRHNRNWDRYQLGNLATLFRLESRLTARTKQLDYEVAFSSSPDLATIERFRDGPLADPSRTMLGATQERWLANGLAGSTAAGTRWQILLQQTILAPTRLPVVNADWFAPGARFSERQQVDLAAGASLSAAGLPLGLDRWDGYPAARTRLLASAVRANANLIVLSGDSHNAWAYDLTHEGKSVGVELAGHAVSSLGIEKRFSGDAIAIARSFIQTNPHLRWCDTSRRGYMVIDIRRNAVTSEWLFLGSRDTMSATIIDQHQMVVAHRAKRFAA